jgi:hypothetical protein
LHEVVAAKRKGEGIAPGQPGEADESPCRGNVIDLTAALEGQPGPKYIVACRKEAGSQASLTESGVVTQPALKDAVFPASSNNAGECDIAGLSGRKIAVLATDGMEQVELTEPHEELMETGVCQDHRRVLEQAFATGVCDQLD